MHYAWADVESLATADTAAGKKQQFQGKQRNAFHIRITIREHEENEDPLPHSTTDLHETPPAAAVPETESDIHTLAANYG